MEKINYPSKEEILNYFGDKPIRFIGYILGFNNRQVMKFRFKILIQEGMK